MTRPLLPQHPLEPSDEELVARATAGDAQALNQLLRRHQTYVYNLALFMLQSREDAEDATQEVLVKLATTLASFRRESRFRTWAHRIAVNHVLDRKRSRPEQAVHGFDCYGDYLERAPDEDLAFERGDRAEIHVLIEEAKRTCTMGMLLCLDRDQRLVFVLGEVFETSDKVAADILGVSRDNFRQKLARAREQLYGFMRGRCSLVAAANPCRCARKTRAFIRDGIVDSERLQFAGPQIQRVRATAASRAESLDALREHAYQVLYREFPLYEPPDVVARLRSIIEGPAFRTTLDLN